MSSLKRVPFLTLYPSDRDGVRNVVDATTSHNANQPTLLSAFKRKAAVDVEVRNDSTKDDSLNKRNRSEHEIHKLSIQNLCDSSFRATRQPQERLRLPSAEIGHQIQLLPESPKILEQTKLSPAMPELKQNYNALEAQVTRRVASQDRYPSCLANGSEMRTCGGGHFFSDEMPTGQPEFMEAKSVPQSKLRVPREKKLKPSAPVDKSLWISPIQLKKIQGNPPIFSGNRQELCETLPYFRSFHGGHYVSGGRTLGYLLDGCPAPRDAFDDSGRVIISHGGGGSSRSQEAPKKLVLTKSQQRTGHRVQALINCIRNHLPVVLLAGSNYEKMPWLKLKHEYARYVVLGYYLVTHCWPEKEYRQDKPDEAHTRFKFRFQWMTSQGDPWWLPDLEEYILSNPPTAVNEGEIALAAPRSHLTTADYEFLLEELDKLIPQDQCHLPDPTVAASFEPVGLTEPEDQLSTSEKENNRATQYLAGVSTSMMSSHKNSSDCSVSNAVNREGLESPRVSFKNFQSLVERIEKFTPQVWYDSPDSALPASFEEVALNDANNHLTSENGRAAQDLVYGPTTIRSRCKDNCNRSDSNVLDCEGAQPLQKALEGQRPDAEVNERELGCWFCKTCSLQIYKIGWMCLYETCDAFFKLNGNDVAHQEKNLVYLPWVLTHQPHLERERRVPLQLQPLSLQQIGQLEPKRRLNSDSKKGLYCIDCGRMSSRIYWGALVCSNQNCVYTVNLEVDHLYTASELTLTRKQPMSKTLQPSYFSSALTYALPDFDVVSYKFNDGSSYVIHAIRKDGFQFNAPGSLLANYQSCIGPQDFKRNKMRTNLVTGMVAQQFTLNAGQAYKFCTEVQTVSWQEAPYPLHEAKAQIDQFVEALNAGAPDVAGGEPIPNSFNELLSCCYLPDTGMNYHADNELGVGPLVASLSLGSTALMRFKPKKVKNSGVSPSRAIPSDTPCNPQYGASIPSDTPGPMDTVTKDPSRPVLELRLQHGDILLQFGSKLQADWVHSVKTKGFRIAATARHIDPTLNC